MDTLKPLVRCGVVFWDRGWSYSVFSKMFAPECPNEVKWVGVADRKIYLCDEHAEVIRRKAKLHTEPYQGGEEMPVIQECAKQEAPIFNILGEINNEAARLEETIARLEARLGHVLAPAPPTVDGQKPPPGSLPASAVMLKLSDIHTAIFHATRSLQELIERVDV